jgi:hypothetical protein
MKHFFQVLIFTSVTSIYAQVGIGNIEPKAELHISTTDNGIPALRLQPQSNPEGTATGQLAVIENELFLYDATRGKWLSIEANKYSFGLEDGADNEPLEYVGDVQNNGPKIKENSTIVYVALNARDGQTGKDIQMIIDNVNVPFNANPNINGLIKLNPYSYINTAFNMDLNAGQVLKFFVTAAGNATTDITVDVWIKKRK